MVSGKKAELPERRDAFTVDVEYAAAASESVVRGDGNAGVVVTYHDGITVEKLGAEIRRKNTGMCTCRRRQPEGGIRHATGSLSEEATNSGFPTGSLQRRGKPELPLPDHKNGRNGDGNADTA
nr:hypothetical protein [Escherichia coli]